MVIPIPECRAHPQATTQAATTSGDT